MIRTPQWVADPLLTGYPRVLWWEAERSHPFSVSAKEVEWRGNWILWGSERVVINKVHGKGLVFQPHWGRSASILGMAGLIGFIFPFHPLVSPGNPCCLCLLLPGLYYVYALTWQRFSSQSLENLCLPFPFWNASHSLRLSANATSSMKPFLIFLLPLCSHQFTLSTSCTIYTFVITLILSFLRSIDVFHLFHINYDLLECRSCVLIFLSSVCYRAWNVVNINNH